MHPINRRGRAYEWPTHCLLVLTYLCYTAVLIWSTQLGPVFIVLFLGIILTLHSSITHEVVHIFEQKYPIWGRIIVFPAIGLFIPYNRFRDQHLAHHQNENLTDPLDDPESYYLPQEVWIKLPRTVQIVLSFNNTLFGRMLVGPLIGQLIFMGSDARAIWRGDRAALVAWLIHIPAIAIVIIYVNALSDISAWTYLAGAYLSLSILKIRTYLEHRAEQQANGRSVIIEDRGPLAILFLNNNYHAAHHAHPMVPWYNLPLLYRRNQAKFLSQNRGYYYRSYWDVFRHYLFHRKEPVAHPIWRLSNRNVR